MEPNDFQTYTVKEMLTRLESKVDKVLDDHEDRLRKGEIFRYKVMGAIGILSIAVGVIGDIIAQ